MDQEGHHFGGAGWANVNSSTVTFPTVPSQPQLPGYDPSWQLNGQVSQQVQWPQQQNQFAQVLPGYQYPAQVHHQLPSQWADAPTPTVTVVTMPTEAALLMPTNTTTVIVQQQKQKKKDWEKGIFECCSHADVCLCGLCCLPCLICTNAMSVDADMCVCCILFCFFPCCLPSYIRGEARKKYRIKGSGCEDCFCGHCCTACVMCQVANEIKEH